MATERPTRRRGPPALPPEQRYQPWHVTLPPELSERLYVLLKDDSAASKSELLTKLLESHPTVRAVNLPPKDAA